MAMVATKLPYNGGRDTSSHQIPSALRAGITSNPRVQLQATSVSHGSYASPTDSEFSDVYDGQDSVRSWDDRRVGEWLRSINCGQYEQIFIANHFNGDNLLECDQAVLKELGIKKIGDRVRIFVAIKSLRNRAYAKQRKRNRDSFAALDSSSYTPSNSSDSPRPLNSATLRSQPTSASTLSNRRASRIIDGSMMYSHGPTSAPVNMSRLPSRPESPQFDADGKSLRQPAFASPIDPKQGSGYFSNPSSASTVSGKRPGTPGDSNQSSRLRTHTRQNPSIDGPSTMGSLPQMMHGVRVIYAGGETRVVRVQNCKTSEEIVRSTLRKYGLREDQARNYCFWVLDGTEPDPAHCRKIPDAELVRICGDRSRAERNRLILRKVHAGEPGDEELQRAAQIATEENNTNLASSIANKTNRTVSKITQLTGEPWENLQHPLSPAYLQSPQTATFAERERNINSAARNLEKPPHQKKEVLRPLRQFFGQRPPSELISSDLATYFPEHQKEEIEKTVRMSIRRSARMSRVQSRLSMASNISYSSSLKDAPPIPNIADAWLTGRDQPITPRPLSIAKMGTSYRDSVTSSVLEPLQEESSLSEPDRKSYVSFASGSDTASASDMSGRVSQSYYEDNTNNLTGNDPNGSYQEISKVLEEDGEGKDDELAQYLTGNSWEDMKWLKGRLIGQGSFGSVYLALHAITGELMAVKQVEMPSDTGSQIDNKKKGMVDALKREIGLLKELQHPNIVQYLGSSSDEEHLNIFLEYVPGGSVAAMLTQYGPLSEPLIRNFVRQILTGLAYLHGREIIHRDIKGANVLVDNKGGIKISDFGISKRVEASSLLNSGGAGHKNRPSLQGSVFWMAPEVVKQTSYTRKADIWSLGCLVVEMFTGTHPYPDCSQLQAIFKIGNSKASPTIPEEASPEAKAFLERTFELDHNKRPSADELLLNPFLNPIA